VAGGGAPDVLLRALSFLAVAALFLCSLPDLSARRRYLVLTAASPLLLVYASEARPYALLSALGMALFLLALSGEERGTRLAAAALVTAAALYTHYLALFLVGSLVAVALFRRRLRSVAALLLGSAPFAFWVPVFLRQPAEAVAWMHEPPALSAGAFLSALGGVGRIPDPLGGPLPALLVWMGAGIGALLLWTAAAREDPAVRNAVAVVALTLGAVLAVSAVRPLAFPGRSELAVVPIWLWAVARAGEGSTPVRGISAASVACGAAACALVLLSGRPAPTYAEKARELASLARPGDLAVAGGAFYLPARLEADRGKLSAALVGLPAEMEQHPGWIPARRLDAGDLARLSSALDALPPSALAFLLLPGPLASEDVESVFRGSDRTRVLQKAAGYTLWVREPAGQ
jgi:hypothetical protein